MADLSGGNAFIDVMPSMRGYFTRVRSEITNNPVEHEITPTVNRAALERAQQQVEQASQRVERARRKEADSVGAVRVAEAQLTQVRNNANSTDAQRIQAQERYERALRNAEAATRDLQRQEANFQNAQAREVRVRARFDGGDSDQQARSWVDRMRDHADNASDAFGRAQDRMNGFADKIQGVSAAASGALLAMGGMAFKLASDWEQALGAIETVFGQQAGMMVNFAENAARTVGLAKTEYAELANVLGASLKNMGIPMDQLGEKTNGLITIGADLAATYGGTTKEAVEALSSALRGETDPIERYGISIKEATIEAEMAKRGLSDLEGEAATLARTETLLSLITQQSGGAVGAFGREGDTAANKIQVAKAEVTNLATELGAALLPIVGDVAKSLSGLVGWLGENKWAAYAVVGVLGLLAAAFVVAKIAAIGFGIAAAVAAAPVVFTVGLIVAAIALLVGGIVLLWKKNEGFRNAIKGIWAAIVGFFQAAWRVIQSVFQAIWTAVQWVGDKFVWLWQNVIQPAFEFIGNVISWVYNNVILPIFTAIKIAVAIVATAFILAWQVISGVFNVFASVAMWIWNEVLSPVFGWIRTGFEYVGAFFNWVWLNIIQPVWNALGTGIRWVVDNLITPAFDWIKLALQWVGDFFGWIWNSIINPVWTALGNGVRWVVDNIVVPAFDWLKAGLQAVGDFFGWIWNSVIRPVWDALGAGIRWVIDNVVDPAFNFLKDILNKVGEAFDKAVQWIGQVWDRIKAIAAKPVRFVVETVYNKGIVAAWNKVAGWLGINPLEEANLGELGNYARGTGSLSTLPGYTPNRDVYDFYTASGLHIKLGGGEAILRPEVARVLGPDKIDRLNATAAVGGPSAVAKELGAYAGGGVVESIIDKVNRFFPGMSITSTYRDSNDLHGRGLAVDFSNGYDTTPEMQAAARFFYNNYGPMLAELIHWPLAGWENVDEGRPFDFGAGTNAEHRNHVHVAAYSPLPEPGSPIEPIESGGGGWFGRAVGWLRRRVGDAFDAIMTPIGNAIPEFGGAIGELPKKAFGKFKDTVRDWLIGKADEAEGSAGGPGSGPVVDQVKEAFAPYGWDTGAQWDAVDYIVSHESSWNPLARNPSSGAFGLFQFLGSTKDAYLPDENPNPLIQGRAGARYISDRYGDPIGARAFWEANHWYDDGGVAVGDGIMLKKIIRPERVLSARQTEAFESMLPLLERMDAGRGIDERDLESARLGGDFVAQKIENQWVVDPHENSRQVRRASKRALAGSGVVI